MKDNNKDRLSLFVKVGKVSTEAKITKSANNPYFRSKYANLDTDILPALNPLLQKHGLTVIHYTDIVENGKVILTTVVIDTETGATIESSLPITKTKVQEIGAEITYFRRYNIGQLFNLQLGDDVDGQMNMVNGTRQRQVQKPQVVTSEQTQMLIDKIEEFGRKIGKTDLKEVIMKDYKLSSFNNIPVTVMNSILGALR
jgi:hypothetical protein